ncbi:hypothetical protein [Alloacidobacterium sp.]|uniref:hypothetical protein n=1 Tax=Alloacidobacterium sp. TaxID=2951999 RepID=UPI002D2A8864|nr:hypothetical protein [Alloacidobacterium sp.]HYK35076.1 hypothetical protein [Alloacidobacterium sp.]
MKLITLVLLTALAIGAFAQSSTQQKSPDVHIQGITVLPPGPILNLQTGCPVAFTNVDLKQNARYMPVEQSAEADDSLVFNYKNQSGKQIKSIEVHVVLYVKPSIYDLDAITATRDMTLSGHSGEALPLNLFAYGVVRVTLEQVNYADGTVWTPNEISCHYDKLSGIEQIAK